MLELATKQRKHIANRLGTQGRSQQQMSKFLGCSKKFPNAKIRTENTDMYNCHGLVFATRRTNIDDSLEVQKIIKQDNYEEIDVKKVLPGDIIIYYADDNDAEHSGIVISVPDDVLPIPNVISKWGQLEEYIHPANQCPYHFINAKYYRMKI